MRYKLSNEAKTYLASIYWRGVEAFGSFRRSVCGVDSIYYRMSGEITEIMRVLGRQDITESF